MIIIGITGTNGSGKGTVVEYLKVKYNFKHFSARAFISEEITKRGLPNTRDNTRLIGNELRATYGASYIAEKLYERAINGGGNAVLESLRATGEVEALRDKPGKFYLLAVDADPKLRYDRILQRKSSTDYISFEKFIDQEANEMSDDSPSGMNIAKCMKMADAQITNNGSMNELHQQIDQIMKKLRS